jgi:hypothetical protein
MLQTILNFVASMPIAGQIVFWIGAMRVLCKPIMLGVAQFVELTPTKKDDEWFHKVISHPIYRAIVVVIDCVTSIKLPVAIVKQ